MTSKKTAGRTRVEHDSMGELQVPAEALWGAQTQRAVQNFPISGRPMPRGFIRALGLVKAAAAEVNAGLGLLPKGVAKVVQTAANEVARGEHDVRTAHRQRLGRRGADTAAGAGDERDPVGKGLFGHVRVN